MDTAVHWDVAIVGGGVAGRSAAIFVARHGLETVIIDAGESILRRNASLESYPGLPPGTNARWLLERMRDQAIDAGGTWREERVEGLRRDDSRFHLELETGETMLAERTIVATKNEVGFLSDLDGVELLDRGKLFVKTDERGRTGVDGLYAAGRVAGTHHQAIVAAGDGAAVGVTLLEDHPRPFYHDWVTPTAYFTGRDREIPPGCEEIPAAERRDRERRASETLRNSIDSGSCDPPDQHPSVASEDE